MHLNHYGDIMTSKSRPRFNPEFKVECSQLVLDQRYSVREAADAMNVGHSALDITSALLMLDSINGLR
jgi:transposase